MNTSARACKAARSTDTGARGHDSPGGRGASRAPRPGGIDFVDRASVPPGQGLPPALRSGIESLSGLPMDYVRVHYDSPQPTALGTLAYAQGSEIHLAPGQEQALPHEAWHVVQQAQGRVAPTVRADDGRSVNDQSQLEHEADTMGAKALPAGPVAAPRSAQATPQTALSAAPAQGASATAVVQCWPGFIDRWLQKRQGFGQVEDPDHALVSESKAVGHRAQSAKEAVEARRRDKFGEGAKQVGKEVGKLALDAVGTLTTGVPIGSALGGAMSLHGVASSGHQAYRETGESGSAVKAVGKEVLKEGVGEVLGNIPVIGEFIGMVEGFGLMAYSVLESEDSRFEQKQTALDSLIAKKPLIDEARQRLAMGDLEAKSQGRLEKAVKRYDEAVAAGRNWQQGKMATGKARLLMQEL